jgi:hypothetical protein
MEVKDEDALHIFAEMGRLLIMRETLSHCENDSHSAVYPLSE